MGKFEMVEIFKPNMSQSDIELELNTQRNMFGNMKYVKIEYWGKKKLAYPIKGYNDGNYVLVNFNSNNDNDEILNMEKIIKSNNDIIKFIIVNRCE